MPGAAERGAELREQMEAFVARLRGGGGRPRSEDTARHTLALLRKIIAHGHWGSAGERLRPGPRGLAAPSRALRAAVCPEAVPAVRGTGASCGTGLPGPARGGAVPLPVGLRPWERPAPPRVGCGRR